MPSVLLEMKSRISTRCCGCDHDLNSIHHIRRCNLKLASPSYASFGVWVCGCVDVWMCGCVAMWLCGCARPRKRPTCSSGWKRTLQHVKKSRWCSTQRYDPLLSTPHAHDFGYGNPARACLGPLRMPVRACWCVRASVCAQLKTINDTAAAASTAAERKIAATKQASHCRSIVK